MTEDGDKRPEDDDLDLQLHVCEKCGATYLIEIQLRAHQSAHSNYFEEERYKDD